MNAQPASQPARRRRALLLAIALPLLGACATPAPMQAPPRLIHHGPVVEVPDVDVLAVTPEMRAFLQRYVLTYGDTDTRVRLLTMAVTDASMLGFRYDVRHTLTAGQAFERRTGNCMGFSNLVVALAREAGLDAQFQEVVIEPEWHSEQDTLMVAKHVNVHVDGRANGWVLDSGGQRVRPGDRRRLLDDSEALALHYNNLAVDALVAGDLYRAWAWLDKAVTTAPGLHDAWINLGVVYARNGQVDDAARIYQGVLERDPGQYSALSNLYALYESMDDQQAMAKLWPRVQRYRQRNPYYLLQLGEDAMAAADYTTSRELLARAIEVKPSEHQFHYAMARAEFLAGDLALAEQSLARARDLAPPDIAADYARPLAELAAGH